MRVNIKDPIADQCPFSFQIGDRVARKESVQETIGQIVDGEFEGSVGGGSYDIIYTVKIRDCVYYNARELELKKIDPNEHL